MIALCPSNCRNSAPKIQPRDEDRRVKRFANCWMRPNNDSAFINPGIVWINPTSGCASINFTKSTNVSPHYAIRIEADEVAIPPPQLLKKSRMFPLFFPRC